MGREQLVRVNGRAGSCSLLDDLGVNSSEKSGRIPIEVNAQSEAALALAGRRQA